jgi:serine/threonine protein phosphatase PrpC
LVGPHGCSRACDVKVNNTSVNNTADFRLILCGLTFVQRFLERSLGDVVAHSAGVISEPEFSEFELDPKTDKFIVVATDGLWEFVNNQETLEMVEGQVGPAQAVDTLVTEAGTRWMQEEQVIDDTTVIVANLFGWKSSA